MSYASTRSIGFNPFTLTFCIFLLIIILTGLYWRFAWYLEAGTEVLGTEIFRNRGGGPAFTSNEDVITENESSIA